MSSNNDCVSASQLLLGWVESLESDVTFYEVLELLSERGFGLLMLFFSLPLSIPLPVPPGFTTVLAAPLVLLSAQLIWGCQRPWIPKWLGQRTIKHRTLARMIHKACPVLKRMERFIAPRIACLNGYMGEKLYAVMSMLCAISIAIPLPLTNFIPAAGIAMMSLGTVNKDGLAILLGMAVGVVGLFISGLVIFFGPKFVMNVFGMVNSWFV